MADLMIKHQLGASICCGVLTQQHPGVGVDVVAVEVAFQGLAVPHRGIQVPSQGVDLPSLDVNAHLVTGPGTGTTLRKQSTTKMKRIMVLILLQVGR